MLLSARAETQDLDAFHRNSCADPEFLSRGIGTMIAFRFLLVFWFLFLGVNGLEAGIPECPG